MMYTITYRCRYEGTTGQDSVDIPGVSREDAIQLWARHGGDERDFISAEVKQ